jgi:hypothetical protein
MYVSVDLFVERVDESHRREVEWAITTQIP